MVSLKILEGSREILDARACVLVLFLGSGSLLACLCAARQQSSSNGLTVAKRRGHIARIEAKESAP